MKVQTSIRIDQDVFKKIEEIAKSRKRSKSFIIEEAAEMYVLARFDGLVNQGTLDLKEGKYDDG